MKKKTLLLTTLAGTMFLAGLTLSGVNAATEGKVVINEQEAKVVVEVSSETYQLTKADLEAMIEAEYKSRDLVEVIAKVEGETAGTGAKVKLAGNLSETKELTVIVCGDVTGDGAVNVLDLNEMRKVALDKQEFDDLAKEAANVMYDEDGAVNVLDANRIAQFMLNPETMPETGYIEDEVLPEVNIKVHEHTFDESDGGWEHVEGTNQHSRTCQECEKTVVEDCTFSEWTSKDGKVATRTCTAEGCDNTEEKTLQDILNDESVTEFTIDKVDTADAELTIPAGKTLTVSNTITTSKNKITVSGNLVLEKEQTNLKLAGTGTVVYAPKATDEENFKTKFPNAEKILSGIGINDQSSAKSLKYEIRVPEMEEPQTITETKLITLEDGWNLTVDLGNNTLETKDTNNTFITNKGDLTLRNGTVEIPDTSKKFVIGSDSNKTATLNLENVNIIGHSGISTNGKLVMNGGSIESTGNASQSRALQIHGGSSIAAVTTELNDVDIKSKHVGIFIGYEPFQDLVMNGGSITIEGSNEGVDGALTSYSQYSTITLNGTNITSDRMGIYLQNNGGNDANPDGGNVAYLNDVTIKSNKVCIWTCDKGDRFEVNGGSYISTEEEAIRIYSLELNTLKDCYVEGKKEAIKVLGSLLKYHNFSEFVQKTGDVKVVDL